jgi:O-antigen ligase
VIHSPVSPRGYAARLRIDSGALLAWLLPISLITYLGVRGGGYDQVVSSQVAIAFWWLIFLVAALRLASVHISTAGWVWLGLLVAYAAWTTLSLIWTVSRGNTVIDVSLMALYCGTAILAIAIRGSDTARHMLHAVAAAILAICILALLSRLRFDWFSPSQTAQLLPSSLRRLSYPINYWNALAALMAIGIPLILYVATGARSLVTRALAGAAVPLLALCAFLTASRGGTIEIAIAVVVFLALAPDRLPKLAVTAVCAAGSALLIAAANQRGALRSGVRTALAHRQDDQLIVIALIACAGVGLLVAAIAHLDVYIERPRYLRPSRALTARIAGAVVLVGLLAFLVGGGPGFLSREWDQFKNPFGPSSFQKVNAFQRLGSVTGEGRYQYWQAAAHAGSEHPLTGTGAGTFVFWWAAHGTLAGGYVHDAHSLYLQSFAELGYPGMLLIVAAVASVLIAGVVRAVRGRDPTRRLAVAAATAGAAAFTVSTAIDWIWLIPVLPLTWIVLAVAILSPEPTEVGASSRSRRAARLGLAARTGGALAALAVVVVVALPMAASAAVRDSQALAGQGKLAPALTQALRAVRLEPYAASPRLQEALVLEQAGDLRAALGAARQAIARETTNWQNWFIASRLEARTGHFRTAIADYVKARSLDPHAPLFDTPTHKKRSRHGRRADHKPRH